jgi:hypothetical protein
MKSITRNLTLAVSKLDAQKIRLIVLVATLALFAISAGAAGCPGGGGH